MAKKRDKGKQGYPVEEWIPHKPADSADYLDRPAPVSLEDLEGEERAEVERRLAEKKKESERHAEKVKREVKPRMSTKELREAGVTIDLPMEPVSSDPQPIRYSDGTTSDDFGFPWSKNKKQKKQPRDEGAGSDS